jgi:uncharacterized protein involved in exopolysaccharide biosynthesis
MPVNFQDAGRKVDETTRRMEDELQQFIKYLNNDVVPKIRTQGSQALRSAAQQLARLADSMDDRKKSGEGTK